MPARKRKRAPTDKERLDVLQRHLGEWNDWVGDDDRIVFHWWPDPMSSHFVTARTLRALADALLREERKR